MVTYGRSFSSLAFEMPLMASRSSTLWNGPLFSRKSTMDLAVLGPMPGRVSSWAMVAVFRLTGCAGRFFWPIAEFELRQKISKASRKCVAGGREETACEKNNQRGAAVVGDGEGVVWAARAHLRCAPTDGLDGFAIGGVFGYWAE